MSEDQGTELQDAADWVGGPENVLIILYLQTERVYQ